MEKKRVYIIIVNYKGKNSLATCLKSVYASDYLEKEVVVVDNASKDGSLELAKEQFTRTHFIISEKNRGFAAGANLGIRFALERTADYILLLNNDAKLERKTLSNMMRFAEKLGPSIVSPKIVFPQGKEWFSGGKINWIRFRAEHSKNKESFKDKKNIEYVPGCAMLIEKTIFSAIGLFDEQFFLYYEDVDFCFRAGEAKFPIRVLLTEKVFHEEKSEKNQVKKVYYLVQSGEKFFKKYALGPYFIWFHIFYFLRRIKNYRDRKRNPHNPMTLSVSKALRNISYE
ncbi:MAG: glycosyltransferase family 2 protein [Candidatus Moranbacteria bacterium]|nr:glycosyltransferase family 2 protein [Candidatus Moranbacteria bacterium]